MLVCWLDTDGVIGLPGAMGELDITFWSTRGTDDASDTGVPGSDAIGCRGTRRGLLGSLEGPRVGEINNALDSLDGVLTVIPFGGRTSENGDCDCDCDTERRGSV